MIEVSGRLQQHTKAMTLSFKRGNKLEKVIFVDNPCIKKFDRKFISQYCCVKYSVKCLKKSKQKDLSQDYQPVLRVNFLFYDALGLQYFCRWYINLTHIWGLTNHNFSFVFWPQTCCYCCAHWTTANKFKKVLRVMWHRPVSKLLRPLQSGQLNKFKKVLRVVGLHMWQGIYLLSWKMRENNVLNR